MPTPDSTLHPRRSVLRLAALAGAAGAAGAPLLAACSSGGAAPGGPAKTGEEVPLPSYRAVDGLRPDLAGDPPQGIQDGFFSMPADLVTSVTDQPLAGGEVTAMVPTLAPPPPPLNQNHYLQALNTALGGTLSMRTAPSSEYGTKIDTMLAGGDVTDLALIQDFSQPRLDKLLENTFADLSDELSGDKINSYPNLAAIPTFAWTSARMFGRLWGVPVERPLLWNITLARPDLLAEAGVSVEQVKTTDDFTAMCGEVTDAKRNRWALTGSYASFSLTSFAAAFGAPNGWRKNPDGTLTRDWETDEYVAAIEYVAGLFKAGYFHPESANLTGSDINNLFIAGKVAAYQGYLSGWGSLITVNGLAESQVTAMPLFNAPGATAALYHGTGVYGSVLIKKGDPDRVRQCLRLLDYFAAPLGTKEYLLNRFGVEGKDHTLINGQPELTETGTKEIVNTSYLSGVTSRAMYSGTHTGWVRAQHAWQQEVAPHGLTNPTYGFYSESANRAGEEEQPISDAIPDVIMGRKPISAFTDAVRAWSSGVGAKIKDELQNQL